GRHYGVPASKAEPAFTTVRMFAKHILVDLLRILQSRRDQRRGPPIKSEKRIAYCHAGTEGPRVSWVHRLQDKWVFSTPWQRVPEPGSLLMRDHCANSSPVPRKPAPDSRCSPKSCWGSCDFFKPSVSAKSRA